MFLQDFELEVDIDFQLDGQSVSWADASNPGPKMWGDEDESVELSTSSPVRGRTPPTTQIAVTSDGKVLAVGRNSAVRLYEVEGFEMRAEITGLEGDVQKLMFMDEPSQHLGHNEPGLLLIVEIGVGDRETSKIAVLSVDHMGQIIRSASKKNDLNGHFPAFGLKPCSHMGCKILYIPAGYTVIRVVSLVESEAKKEVCVLNGHTRTITWASWSPDDKIIATASWDGTYRLWDAETGEQRHVIQTQGQNWTGVFFNDAKHVLLAGAGPFRVGVYGMFTGELIRWVDDEDLPKQDWIRIFAVQTAKGMVVFKRGREVVVWRPFQEDGTVETILKFRKDDNPLRDRYGGVNLLKFVDVGRKLIARGEDGTVFVWDVEDGKKWRFQRPKGVSEGGGDGDVIFIRRKGADWILAPGEKSLRCWKI